MASRLLSRKRDRNGQFVSEKEPTASSLRQIELRKERSKKNKQTGATLFCMYLDVCFVKTGSSKDWVMADANIGPLAQAAIALIKSSFLPQANERCERVRKRFFNFEEGKKQSDIKQEYVLDGNNLKGKRKRRRIFRGWRLANLGWDSEVAKLKEWIEESLRNNALNVKTSEEAYEVIRSFFVQRKKHKTETYYVGYPPVQEENSTERLDSSGETAIDLDESQNTVMSETRAESEIEVVPETSMQDCIAQSARELFETAPTDGDTVYFSQIKRIINAARNDRLFFLLCKISEDVAECKIDCIAAAMLDICKADDLKCDIFVTDALQYASARQKGVTDIERFHLQKHRVRTNTELLKIARASIPGKLPYEEMTWLNFPLQVQPNRG